MENQHTTINLAFICLLFVRFVCAFFSISLSFSLSFYFAVSFAQMSEGARWCAKYTSTKKATQDNNTKVQSSSSPSLSQEFVQSTKYTRSQFTAFICRLKWCQSILNSAQRGRVKNRKWQWVFGIGNIWNTQATLYLSPKISSIPSMIPIVQKTSGWKVFCECCLGHSKCEPFALRY